MSSTNNDILKELQEIEYDILIEFDRICKKHNLKYILTAGTLLGCVRHNGFIPWDDDVDVAMPREDYNKFIEIYEKELDTDKYYFQSLETDDKYGLPLSKLRRKGTIFKEQTNPYPKEEQGVWIDIFPMDKISENKIISFLTYCKVFYYKTIIAHKQHFTFASKGIKKIIFSIIKFNSLFYSIDYAKKRYFSILNKENKKKTNNIINYGGAYLLKEITPRDIIDDIITHPFEGKQFNIPKDYDSYLTRLYGDYMKLPPEEKRASHHLVEEIKLLKNKNE